MENITIEKFLNSNSLLVFYQAFIERTGCNWALEQFKKSLKNQPYLNFLVFKREEKVLGIVSYSTSNHWNKKMYDIEYAINDDMIAYMKSYQKEVMDE